MSQLFSNNAKSVLLSSISSTALELSVRSGDELKFPIISSANDHFLLTVEVEDVIEIFKVTATVGNVYTVGRAQEGTVAKAWIAGSPIELRLTAGTLQKIQSEIGAAGVANLAWGSTVAGGLIWHSENDGVGTDLDAGKLGGIPASGYVAANNAALTGVPTAPTAAPDVSTTQLATTAFVTGQAASVAPAMDNVATVGTSLKYAREDHMHPRDSTLAPILSPQFTGQPEAPTAATSANNLQIANTAFVKAVVAGLSGGGGGGIDIPGGTPNNYMPVTNNENWSLQSITSAVQAALASINFAPQVAPTNSTSVEDQYVSGSVFGGASTVTGTLKVLDYTVSTLGSPYPGGIKYNAGVVSTTNPLGQFTILEDGTWQLTPKLYTFGVMSPIRFTVTNGLTTAVGVLNITLTWVNHAPVTSPNVTTTDTDTPITINVLANDIEYDSQAMIVSRINGTALGAGQSVGVTNATVQLQSDLANIIVTPSAGFNGVISFNYSNRDTMGLESIGTVTITVAPATSNATSNYLVGQNTVIPFNFGANIIAKNQTVLEPTSGATIKRITDVTNDLPGQTAMYNAYSRYPTENVTGEYCLAFAGNSTTCQVINRATGAVAATLAYDNTGLPTHTIGAYHEIRWHYTMAHPYRVYYVRGTQFWMIDDIRDQANTRSMIKDFGSVINWGTTPNSERRIYMDQEGNSSLDSNHWAWMAVFYENNNFRVRCFLHYKVDTDTTHFFYPSDIQKFVRFPAVEIGQQYFRARPNTIEVAPDGSGILIMNDRAYAGVNDGYINTYFEAPYFWPINFEASFEPFRMMADATHSGWSSVQGNWYYVAQDNRRDKFCAVPISGPNKGYGNEGNIDVNLGLGAGVIDFHTDGGYYPGVHFAVCTGQADGWTLMSTYAVQTAASYGLANALFMIQIKPEAQAVKWHVAPTCNQFPAANKQDYNEAPASINLAGTRIYTCGDWNGTSAVNPSNQERYVDLYTIDLPNNYTLHFAPAAPAIITGATISGTPTQGSTLTGNDGSYSGNPTPALSRAWLRNDVPVAGQTGSTYVLGVADVGTVIKYRVTAANTEGNVISTSSGTSPIAALAIPVNSVLPVLSGEGWITGSVLIVSTGTWTNSPTGYTYTWYRDGVLIGGQTTNSYQTDEADVGKVIYARVIATNTNGSSSFAQSNSSDVIQALPGTMTRLNFVTSTDPSGSFEATRVLPAFSNTAGKAVVVVTRYAQTPGNTITVTDTSGNTYTQGPTGTAVGAATNSAVVIHYCLSVAANASNVITVTQSDNSSGQNGTLASTAIQYSAGAGSILFDASSNKGTDYEAMPIASNTFNMSNNSVAIAGYGTYYGIGGTRSTGGDTVVSDLETSGWVLERRRQAAMTNTSFVSGDTNNGGYTRMAIAVLVLKASA